MDSQTRPLALITGGSSGIGLELARVFGDNGYDLIVNAENASRLSEAAKELAEDTGAKVETIAADLSTREGVETLYGRVRETGRPLDVLCANAGVGSGGGDFTETDLDKELRLVDLNVRSVVHLTKLVARDMVERGQGKIMITSSIASLMPGPFEAVYAASKAFESSFGEALRNELKDKGVSVTLLKPGPTETNFFRRAEMMNTPAGQNKKDPASAVARQGYKALMADNHAVVSASFATKAQAKVAAVMSDPMRARFHRMQTQPKDYENQGSDSGGVSKGAIAVGAIAAATAAGWWLNKLREEPVEERTRARLRPDYLAPVE